MKVLVTGGAGYIGSVFIRSLISDGHQVRCLDQHAADLRKLLPLKKLDRGRCNLLVGDVRDCRDIKIAVQGVDAVVHLAAVVGSPACDSDPQTAESTNIQGTRCVARATPKDVPLILLSTCSVYGKVPEGICRECGPVSPLTLYGQTKLFSEQFVTEREGVVLRATTAFGASPRFRWDLIIHSFIRLALTTGYLKLFEPHAIRPFIHVEDISKALLFAIQHFDLMTGKIYNIGSEDGTLTKLDLAQRIANCAGLTIELDETGRDPDGRQYRVAFEEVQRLGFSTGQPFDSGLRATVDWMRTLALPERSL